MKKPPDVLYGVAVPEPATDLTNAHGGSLLSVQQAAQLKGVSPSAVYAAVADGRLPHVRVLGRIGLKENDIAAWVPRAYADRPGTPARGGRPLGLPISEETRSRMSEAQRLRWAERKQGLAATENT
jgi:excisionase family DNA binding protein